MGYDGGVGWAFKCGEIYVLTFVYVYIYIYMCVCECACERTCPRGLPGFAVFAVFGRPCLWGALSLGPGPGAWALGQMRRQYLRALTSIYVCVVSHMHAGSSSTNVVTDFSIVGRNFT